MLTRITIDDVASFRDPATLETDKGVNLIYGLNGTGKSTICRFLRNSEDPEFKSCSVSKVGDPKVLVFNEDFVRENFFESETVSGIFSLSKENKDAESRISSALLEQDKIRAEIEKVGADFSLIESGVKKERASLVDTCFSIKRDFTGGDRVLEFCLAGSISSKDRLFEKLAAINLPASEPDYSPEDLQDEARLLTGSSGVHLISAPSVSLEFLDIEKDPIIAKSIVGGGTGAFAEFIQARKNADWVREGLGFITREPQDPDQCPFCQHHTIDENFISEVTSYFDKTYERDIQRLAEVQSRYSNSLASLPALETYRESPLFIPEIESAYNEFQSLVRSNEALLRAKVDSPSNPIELQSTEDPLERLSSLIEKMNHSIADHNIKVANKESALKNIAQRFWILMRWKYDQSIASHRRITNDLIDRKAEKNKVIETLNAKLVEQASILVAAQAETVNIESAIESINNELQSIGIMDFKIAKHSEHLYQLQRPPGGRSSFKSLSEGERMLISLLYFCELCVGSESKTEEHRDRIVVLDDPVSSMSHIFMFNVGRLIISRFFADPAVKQVFVLTHSLYFFYELTDINKERRDKNQKLFRVSKSASSTAISPMKYEEIQNDYQSYWQIVNDRTTHPALVANCMRNVIEYFFGFVEKMDFNNVFQKPSLQANKFQAFSRYMNRESHSFGQNVFDLKEFDYDVFREGLGLVFEECGYKEHYKQMVKISP